ncbi:MAG TPA: hypothetical protein VFM28_06145 [Nitrososphaeraceae archaeon]|nr:hypothetical protein [Nitrososphaeraceae archaeon]
MESYGNSPPPKALVSNYVLVNNADLNALVYKERYLETIPETVRLILNEYLSKR